MIKEFLQKRKAKKTRQKECLKCFENIDSPKEWSDGINKMFKELNKADLKTFKKYEGVEFAKKLVSTLEESRKEVSILKRELSKKGRIEEVLEERLGRIDKNFANLKKREDSKQIRVLKQLIKEQDERILDLCTNLERIDRKRVMYRDKLDLVSSKHGDKESCFTKIKKIKETTTKTRRMMYEGGMDKSEDYRVIQVWGLLGDILETIARD